MTLNELRYIVAVARERHFGRAADACHISQPTLSVAVRKLEDELGVTLFERGTRRGHGDTGRLAHRRASAAGAGGSGHRSATRQLRVRMNWPACCGWA
jgi:DNA-binding transcriptional LysR family regulator